jgi:anti-anti-sigma factor
MMFNVKHLSSDEVVLYVDGSLSGETTSEFHRQMDELVAGTYKKITLDLSRTPTINSSAMGKIVLFRNKLNAQQRSLQIHGCSESLYKTFLMIRLDTMISIQKESDTKESGSVSG